MRYLSITVLFVLVAVPGCDGFRPIEPLQVPDAPSLGLSAGSCQNVSGTVIAAFVNEENVDIRGTLFDVGGNPVADAWAWIDELQPRGNGAIGVRMRHRYVMASGQVDTVDQGVLSPVDPPLYRFTNRLEVSGGTGEFDGAFGMIRSNGTVDLGNGEIELAYHGRICR
jgi:hypothetical protein